MKSSSRRKSLEVFDLREEDELLEAAAAHYLEKFKAPAAVTTSLAADRLDHVSKYEILECVASNSNTPREKTCATDAPTVDKVAINGGPFEDNGPDGPCVDSKSNATEQFEPSRETAPHFDLNGHGSQPFFPVDDQEPRHSSLDQDASSPGTFSDGKSHSSYSLPGSQSNGGAADLDSDADAPFDDQTSSKYASDSEENVSLDDYAARYSVDPMKVEDNDGTIVICAEYLMYKNKCYIQPLLVFSSNSVRVECSATYGEEDRVFLMWELDDIIRVSCLWLQKVSMVSIVISKAASCFNGTHDSSGIEELKFKVVDSNWSNRQEVIIGLNMRYAGIWEVTSIMEGEEDQIDFNEEKRYFPNFDRPFEDIVYPKGDIDAVSIGKRDIDLLQPETFVNDTIIDFYIKYLKNRLQPEDRSRFHFFNSFFFRKLVDLDKDPSSICDGRAAFLRVRKWTRKINLFEKDYIFVPVNFNLHWSLIVVCHLGEMKSFTDEDVLHSSKVPCVLHMDSIKGNHSGLKNLIQSYLWEEWRERGMEASTELSSKFSNLRFVPLELPQQENAYDCGLFLLHYLELFLEDAPYTFNPLKISKFSGFLSTNWFLPFEASLKRRVIERLIYELLDDQSPEASLADPSDDSQSSGTREVKCQSICNVDSLPEDSSLLAGNSVDESGRGTDANLLAEFSMRSSQGMVLREFFNSGGEVEPLLDSTLSFEQQGYYNFDGTLASVEPEEAEMVADYASYMPAGHSGESEVKEIMGATTSRGPDSVSWQPGLCMLLENEKVNSPEGSIQAMDEDLNPAGTMESNHNDRGGSPDRDLEADRPGSLTPERLNICPLLQSGDVVDSGFVGSNNVGAEVVHGPDQHENPDPSHFRDDSLLELRLDYDTARTRQHPDDGADPEAPNGTPDDRVNHDTDLKLDISLATDLDLGLAARQASALVMEEAGVVEEEPNPKRLRVNPPPGDGLEGSTSEDLHL
ncbi:hypothetical protein MLD38_002005 [Melastoma candidum]|uniref:Uncharacterized protein n=1 Tax=Melastoma candidum TaxID=119954 RepID=A0ACB9SJ13_9MYRT|nr:hypothetical protein MLD38_002005 [Melastoma candidum]